VAVLTAWERLESLLRETGAEVVLATVPGEHAEAGRPWIGCTAEVPPVEVARGVGPSLEEAVGLMLDRAGR
jgi:hypothetical protein